MKREGARSDGRRPGRQQKKPRPACPDEHRELEATIERLRRSQEEVEASRNKYAFLYDRAPVGYLSCDAVGAVMTINRTGADMLGCPPEELVGRQLADFVSERDRFFFRTFLVQVFAQPGTHTCRVGLATVHRRPLYVRIEAMATETGDECLAVLVDITEKKLSEQALSESRYNLMKAQTMTHVGSWSFDPDTGEVRASEELLRILHLPPEEATQEAFAGVVHPEDFENVMAHLRLGVEHGRSYEIEHRLLFRDGSERWVYTIVEPSVTTTGKVVKLYGTTQDITERKRAEVELRNKTNELQAIFDSISDGIIVYDSGGLIQHYNLIGPRLVDREIEAGKPCADLFHAETLSQPRECPVERALQGERVDTSHVCRGGGDAVRYLDITATPIRDALGEKNRALLFLRDVSEKRLQEMHLIQNEKMSSLGLLATGIAHEINNPLTSVAGYAEGLKRRFRDNPSLAELPDLEAFPRYLEVIVREAHRCKGIIDNLLSFGRKSDGSCDELDLGEILLEILDLLKHQSAYRGVTIAVRLQEGLPAVQADPSEMRQVFMNLLINAHHAVDDGGSIEVAAEAEGDEVAVRIKDSGCGIPPETIDRIWDPFFTTKEVGKGIGLGLALTYSIVKRHGGDITVESRVGSGSEFTVRLPAYREG